MTKNLHSIIVTPATSAARLEKKIEARLSRKVTLTGHASSFTTINDASAAAWGAPGVTYMVDQLTVSTL